MLAKTLLEAVDVCTPSWRLSSGEGVLVVYSSPSVHAKLWLGPCHLLVVPLLGTVPMGGAGAQPDVLMQYDADVLL